MAGLQNLLPAPELGQLYVSFDALKDNIEGRQHQVQISTLTEARIAENTPYVTCYYLVNLQTRSFICYVKSEQSGWTATCRIDVLVLHFPWPFLCITDTF